MKKAAKKGYQFLKDIFQYFQYGWKAKLTSTYSRLFAGHLIEHLNRFRHALYTKQPDIKHLDEEKIAKLKHTAKGLYSLLPSDPRFTYSILMPVSQPHPRFFKRALQSLIDQAASPLEILIGFEKPPSAALHQVLNSLKEHYPDKIKEYRFDAEQKPLILNELAKQATGHYLFIMGQEDWIRPDLLFRYEQTLRLLPQPELAVLHCSEHKVNDHDYVIPQRKFKQTSLHFPFIFDLMQLSGLLVPKHLWDQVNGIGHWPPLIQNEDLILRLEALGAHIQSLPFYLYFKRQLPKKQKVQQSREVLLHVLNHYTCAKGLNWAWQLGHDGHYLRAIPSLKQEHHVQVIIPFKDQKKLTLSCVQHVLKQKGVNLTITAVDNASADRSIARELTDLGVEVLTIQEPFNYSRLNNLAVKQTTAAAHCDVLLFLNNDVDLEEEAILEMLRWIDQPQVGMVGCRLHYPDGRLQHGAVSLNPSHSFNNDLMHWEHIEKWCRFDEMQQTKQLGINDAVTAACAMVKRDNFIRVGGFDEAWYPIGYSDTNLAVKLRLIGLKAFYTPYAAGIHHESVSRKEGIEDYENSYWLHRLILEKQHHYSSYFFS